MNVIEYKSGLISIVGVILLLLLTVGIAVSVFVFYGDFQSGIEENINGSEDISLSQVLLDGEDLLFQFAGEGTVSVLDVRVNSDSCGISGDFGSDGLQELNLSSCLGAKVNGPKKIEIITAEGVYARTVNFNRVVVSAFESGMYSFSGHAWGEQLGYLSFNGSNYGVELASGSFSGDAYSEFFGYVSFSGPNYGVFVEPDGRLSGFAWGMVFMFLILLFRF